MKSSTTRAVALVMAVLMVGGVLAGGVAADYSSSPSIDTSSSDDTSTTSDVADGDTLGANNTFAANSSKNKTIEWISDSNETTMWIEGADGEEVYRDDDPTLVNYNSSDADGHYNTTFSHDQLADLERGINANVTTTVYLRNNSTADSPADSNATVYVESDNSTTVQNVDDGDVDEGDFNGNGALTVTNEQRELPGIGNTSFGPGASTVADVETDDRSVNGSETDVVIVLSNQTTADLFDDAAEEAASGESLSGFSLTRTVATVEADDGTTKAIPVYYEEAPDEVESTDTYAVYEESGVGGEDAVTVNLGDDFSDADSVSVNTIGSAGITDMIRGYTSSATSGLLG